MHESCLGMTQLNFFMAARVVVGVSGRAPVSPFYGCWRRSLIAGVIVSAVAQAEIPKMCSQDRARLKERYRARQVWSRDFGLFEPEVWKNCARAAGADRAREPRDGCTGTRHGILSHRSGPWTSPAAARRSGPLVRSPPATAVALGPLMHAVPLARLGAGASDDDGRPFPDQADALQP